MYATVKWCAAVEAEENLTVSFSIIYSLDFYFIFFRCCSLTCFPAIACMYLLCWRSSETSINCILFAGGEAGTWDTQAFRNQITDTNRWRVLSLPQILVDWIMLHVHIFAFSDFQLCGASPSVYGMPYATEQGPTLVLSLEWDFCIFRSLVYD